MHAVVSIELGAVEGLGHAVMCCCVCITSMLIIVLNNLQNLFHKSNFRVDRLKLCKQYIVH